MHTDISFKVLGIDKLARKITEEHLRKGLFSVDIFGWTDIRALLGDFPELIDKHYPGLGLNTKALKKGVDEIKETTQAILERSADVKSEISSLSEKIDTTTKANYPEMATQPHLTLHIRMVGLFFDQE